MSADDFDALVQRFLDGELTGPEAAGLAAELQRDPDRQREVRQHLVLWELWSQQQAPERSADAFVAACRTRLVADRQADRFVAELARRIGDERPSWWSRLTAGLHRVWAAPRPARALAWTTATALLVVTTFWFAGPHTANATTVRGEAVCRLCFLHEGHEHVPVIRVHAPDGTKMYYVESDPRAVLRYGNYCVVPVPVVATGRTELRDGQQLIDIQTLQRGAPATIAPEKPDQRTLFPF